MKFRLCAYLVCPKKYKVRKQHEVLFHFEDFFVKRVFIVNLKQKYLHRQEAFRNINFPRQLSKILGRDGKMWRRDDEKGISIIGRGLKIFSQARALYALSSVVLD